jgi:hypothetical protein
MHPENDDENQKTREEINTDDEASLN